MNAIRHLLIKEFKQIFRTKEMIAIIFGLPLIQLIILGFTITNEVKNVALIISDQDNSPASREIVRAFENTDRFTVAGYETDLSVIEKAIQNWNAQIALIIPAGFGKEYIRNLGGEIQIIADGLDGNTAGIAIGYAQGILSSFHLRISGSVDAPNEATFLN